MATKKENSTNSLNNNVLTKCPMSFTIEMIGGRWKTIILYQLRNEPLRFGQLKKILVFTTEKMLAQQLKQLELDGLVVRDAKEIIPPHVEYYLSEKGKTLLPVLEAMAEWGEVQNQLTKEC
ncbi:helix-turn-helix domain-containing protein [Pedobacter sp. CFBP9032]|uniref:winged helix-turn-helix transcriptional regulator n=1 Tax=Pedobacter sp. CFBP9032 TaxID=3096539 RepID=UPI002A69DFB5|nr:helix-turn-helix domain-containing protein [Pedobacter sp. CFBP9032]MDY0904769.1 helix-turn-helix domain-containing protein [Pedobacter sp. CFBP9032]